MRVITLTTDFGTSDPYVAAMKGVLCRLCDATLVDLTHECARFDPQAAGYLLEAAAFHFPPGTIHVAVVDPGVGTERKILAAECEEQIFVAPDNGCLDFLGRRSGVRCHAVEPDRVATGAVSATFHGRDLFAPAAARLACGGRPGELGPAVSAPQASKEFDRTEAGFRTRVLHVDHFGTLICALRLADLPGPPERVLLRGRPVGPFRKTFGDVAEGEAVAYEGSSGRLEIAVNRGRADTRFDAGRGAEVVVEVAP